jgi:lauroyl/myristoyl acyltransferase
VEVVLGDRFTKRRRRYATWRHFVRVRNDKMLFLILDRLPARALLKRLDVTNKHLLDEALARGQGMYMALSHLGSHHLVINILMEQGYEKIAGVRDSKMGAAWRFVQHKHEQSRRPRVEYFYSNEFPRSIFERFRENYVVGSLIDVQKQRGGHLRTVEADIFGERRSFLTGPLRIAMRCGAPVVQTFVVSRPYFRYGLEFHGPLIDPARNADSREALSEAIRAYAANVEQFARRHPCHISRY